MREIRHIVAVLRDPLVSCELTDVIREYLSRLTPEYTTGAEFVPWNVHSGVDWFVDENLKGAINHSSRGHIASDLRRYFYAAAFAAMEKKSPKLSDFPLGLLPDHENVKHTNREEIIFSDRFRVQLKHLALRLP